MQEYRLEREDVLAAISYAATVISGEEIRQVGSMAGFLVDENLPGLLAQELTARGFSAELVAHNVFLRSADDGQILLFAK